MKILGVDPGKTIGIALLDARKLELLDSQQTQFEDAPEKLQKLVRQADFVAIERFSIGSGRGEAAVSRQYEVLYTIGGVLWLCSLSKTPSRMQTLADARAAFGDEMIQQKVTGMRVAGPHARDALRHALLAARVLQNAV